MYFYKIKTNLSSCSKDPGKRELAYITLATTLAFKTTLLISQYKSSN